MAQTNIHVGTFIIFLHEILSIKSQKQKKLAFQ